MTLGDHAFDQKDTLTYIERETALIRPVNFASGAPGRGAMLMQSRERTTACWSSRPRARCSCTRSTTRSTPSSASIADCPLGWSPTPSFVDFHTEATSEIQAMGHFLDGRVTLVVGTHTHIPTADQRISQGRNRGDVGRRHVRRL